MTNKNLIIVSAYFNFSLLSWIFVWILQQSVFKIENIDLQFLYFTFFKILLWILPVVILLKFKSENIQEVLGLIKAKDSILKGILLGLFITFLTATLGLIFGDKIHLGEINSSF